MKRSRSRTFFYLGLGIMGFVVLAFLAHPIILRSVGEYLVVEDTLQTAEAIVVLNGSAPLRVLEAARLYKEGWAPKIILSQALRRGDFYAFEALDIKIVQEHEYDREALLRSGVPDHDIMIIEEEAANTLAELRAVLRTLQPLEDATLIVVTSNYHTRRTAAIWNYLTDGQIKGLVRWTRSDPSFDPATWWKHRQSIKHLVNEYMGLINYWLGFPLGIAVWSFVSYPAYS